VRSKITLNGWARVSAFSVPPYGVAMGRWVLQVWCYVWDSTTSSWVTQTLVWSDSDETWGLPPYREERFTFDKEITVSFSATSGHSYVVYIGVDVYAAGLAVAGDGCGLIDFDHSSYGNHDIWVRYIQLTW